MTSSIQPPGSKGPHAPDVGAADPGQALEKSASATRAEGQDGLAATSELAAAGAPSSPADAEAWVRQAMESDLAKTLGPEARSELQELLSHALEDDPNLQALLAKLGDG